MSVTQEEVKKIAQNLSKIPGENPKLESDVNSIIEYIDLLSEVDTTGVARTVNVIEEKKSLRTDVLEEKTVTPTELLNCSPQKVVANQIAIGNIM